MRQRTPDIPGGLYRSLAAIRGSRGKDLFAVLLITYILSFITVMVFTQWRTLFVRIRVSDYEIGKVAENDLVLDRDIQFVDAHATDLKRQAAAELALPVYIEQPEVRTRILERFQTFSDTYLRKRAERVSEEKLFFELQASLPGIFKREGFSSFSTYRNPERLIEASRNVLTVLLDKGILSISEKSAGEVFPENIELWRWNKGRQWKDQVAVSEAVTVATLGDDINAVLKTSNASTDLIQAVHPILNRIIEETVFRDDVQTERNRILAREEVQPVQKKLVKGERIIRKGFLITPEDFQEVQALSKYSAAVNINTILGNALFLLMLFIISGIFLSPPLIPRRPQKTGIYLLLGLFLFYLVYAVVILRSVSPPEWAPVSVLFPTAFIAMFALVFINMQASVTLVTVASLSILMFTRLDAASTLFAFMSGIAGAVCIRDSEKRIDLIRAGLFLGLLHILFIMILGMLKNFEPAQYLLAGIWVFINGFLSGILSLGFLPIFEYILNAPTRFRLMELSDLNSPTLKRMLTLASGTYNHSVTVANLAESACREIGANALLARVGAYYHDIGKIDQAEYFIENQTAFNKHDDLKPSLSAAVIKSHVKIGVEKAKEILLPKEIIDIISQHHGRGLITYFYQRAIDEDGSGNVSADDFSYSGSPPTSKEAAVVMLADSVEAASRTLKHPTVAKLEKFVWTIIMDKFNAEQLNDCDLTFRNLEIIKRTFVQILAGHFHSRIEYPKVKENQK